MNYTSTRDENQHTVSSAQAIQRGIAPDGGLYCPAGLPCWRGFLKPKGCKYQDLAHEILSLFLDDIDPGYLKGALAEAYSPRTFDRPGVIGVRGTGGRRFFLELWHGPTAAFKDIALQLLPHLLTAALRKEGERREAVILTATSGDTGKAALSGFQDVPGTRVIVFYPRHGVSQIQKLQMVTQRGGNLHVVAVEGNFDDAQRGVKEIFTDPDLRRRLGEAGYIFSSANSINWGRLVPQIVYYFAGYMELCARGHLRPGEAINIAVPTGNFGNILAAYYALRMGLPVHRLLCCSNENKVLTEFLTTGIYDCRREFKRTISPSMDILISSNLERLLFDISGRDVSWMRERMDRLRDRGMFRVGEGIHQACTRIFDAGWAGEEKTLHQIKATFEREGYLLDPHTAVAEAVYSDYVKRTGDERPTLVASTASPFKFCSAVIRALKGEKAVRGRTELELLDELESLYNRERPGDLAGIQKREVRHRDTCGPDTMRDAVLRLLGL